MLSPPPSITCENKEGRRAIDYASLSEVKMLSTRRENFSAYFYLQHVHPIAQKRAS